MLRVILGITGVTFIAFGVFGGKSLERVHAKVTGVFNPQPGQENVVASVSGVAHSPDLQNLSTEAVELPIAAVNPELPVEQQPVAVEQTKLALPEPNMVERTVSGGVTEVLASARNKEVAVARALLDGGVVKQGDSPLESAVLSNADIAGEKESAVTDIIQTTNGATDNKTLVVLKESVNLRQGPSTDHAVVLELNKGQELMEFKRDGKWVHVGAYGTAGKIGWVHRTLVATN
ncbi:hypothetical protein AB833_22605 [Chromatiales bacterium (ex Bugula neritina AB1)]|nr:hypothetical protein AB833_22605 [Chromatiales bacterium (ex Bugula neritina AB1)]